MKKAGFSGGCHWCTEGVLQSLRGVTQVEQGFLASTPPDDAWAEGVIVSFDPSVISLSVLSEVHLRTHSASNMRASREGYRSAIYFIEEEQREEALDAVSDFVDRTGERVRTKVLTLVDFKHSEERYRNYYLTDPERPFCRRYIDPKLDYIRENFSSLVLPEKRRTSPGSSG